DRLKSAFSDALKRAAVKLGIGRYLYRLPLQWVEYDAQTRQLKGAPKLPDWAQPRELKQPRKAPPPQISAGPDGISRDQWEQIKGNRTILDGAVHELSARERPARLAQHDLQQAKFRRRQVEFSTLGSHLVLDAINANAQVLDHPNRLVGGFGPPLQGADALQQH